MNGRSAQRELIGAAATEAAAAVCPMTLRAPTM